MMIPYQNLYIYEISVAISDSKNFFKEDFIGCWNEGEASFLFFSQPHDEEVRSFTEKKGVPLVSRNVLDYKAWQAGEELKPFKAGQSCHLSSLGRYQGRGRGDLSSSGPQRCVWHRLSPNHPDLP